MVYGRKLKISALQVNILITKQNVNYVRLDARLVSVQISAILAKLISQQWKVTILVIAIQSAPRRNMCSIFTQMILPFARKITAQRERSPKPPQ